MWDSFRAHLSDNVKRVLKSTDVAVIPGGMTSLLQPLDVGVNKPFKDKSGPCNNVIVGVNCSLTPKNLSHYVMINIYAGCEIDVGRLALQ